MERKTVRKWFWAWDFEKEEQWLNAMANSGWLLDGVGWCTFHFVACEPGAYTVRLEMRDRDENYLAFMQETGADGIMIEVHNDPAHALCDGAQSLTPDQFRELSGKVSMVREVLK